ncbi:uncharacterized protein L969DRAFT_517315 [Mixia osmundae IAM 14324]|uniref:NF-kappa-B-activating protein C-terminal domain-containing protein n=1 Tax=Mixia osmundae (strain CBS 9802 / IAM 14324 / JCM 22182 / KY 12970) TaxID=764103 RepID=G7EAL7_MIXOS|nr:uncharacterized protein L969DRAFT_517315 [Mixia osmundae IAM 14324]KEI38196.1 hypothetical protein L969DRAFT_517315 [Mixia osmundae IAM 14324]GAA99877.1 hypothetical protein E5Q_06580 [Mixia osmundae IAM 14324]
MASERRLTPDRALDSYAGSRQARQDGPSDARAPWQPYAHSDQQQQHRSYAHTSQDRRPRDDGFFAARRQQRESSSLTIWPDSPPRPAPESSVGQREPSGSSRKDRHRSSRRDHGSSSRRRHHDSQDESEGRYAEDKDRSDRKRHRDSRKHSSSRRHQASRDDSRDREPKRMRPDDDPMSASDSDSPSPGDAVSKHIQHAVDEDDLWVEKGPPSSSKVRAASPAADFASRGNSVAAAVVRSEIAQAAEESDEEVGPMPEGFTKGTKLNPKAYGLALRPGEGAAMAAYAAEGARIPRRGEVGIGQEEINRFESVGYVMSGNRHKKMNAVRLRKENQVITAEEKRGMLKLQAEEKAKREQQIVSSFRELVDTRLKKA